MLKFTIALSDGDCGAPVWYQPLEGDPIIVAAYEGWGKTESGVADGHGHDMWITKVTNNNVLRFIKAQYSRLT